MYGPLGFVFDLPFGNVTEQFDKNPTQIWIAARALAAVLVHGGRGGDLLGRAPALGRARGTGGGGAAGLRLPARGLLARGGDRRGRADRSGALDGVRGAGVRARPARATSRSPGAAAGLAVAFKYTAGLALLPVAIAALARLASGSPRARSAGSPSAALLAAVVFVALNPYLFDSLDAWWSDLRDQAEVAADQPKPGQESGGVSYYLDSLTWGLGWAAALAALAGAVLELRRDLVRGLMLDRGSAGAVRLPERAVPLLRPLAAAGLPRARDAGRGGDRPAPTSWRGHRWATS